MKKIILGGLAVAVMIVGGFALYSKTRYNNLLTSESPMLDKTETNESKQQIVKGENIVLEYNESNCNKIDGIGANDAYAIANTFKVPMASVKLVQVKWDYGNFGLGGVVKQCLLIFDTPAGPKMCFAGQILSDDGGRSAFTVLDRMGYGSVSTEYTCH